MNQNQNTQLTDNFRTLENLKAELRDTRRNPPASEGPGHVESEAFMLKLFGTTVHRFELDCLEQLRDTKPQTETIQ